MIQRFLYSSRGEWLKAREGKIGGSDAGCILGLNPWKSNVDLYLEKIGEKQPDDLSDNPLVQYGIAAEEHIRALFALDYPDLNVWYEENNMFINDAYPWAHYSADGILTDKSGRTGILEIKTSTVQSALAAEKWKNNHIPQTYFAQLLWGFMVLEADFAILRAHISYPKPGEPLYCTIRHYIIERGEVKDEIEAVKKAGADFARCIKNHTCPELILPEI